ncbi:MAG: FAD synthetase family protein [Pseudothermotoga sp.]
MRKYVATIGVFDGVHIGHQRLLRRVRQMAEDQGRQSKVFVISYPFEYFFEDFDGLIMTVETRAVELAKFIDEVEVIDLLQVKDLMAEDFFERYFSKECSALIVGEDFRFGKGASADVHRLAEMCKKEGIGLEIVEDIVDSTKIRISSSMIRRYIKDGQIEKAAQLLGRDFSIHGFVKRVLEKPRNVVVVGLEDKFVVPKGGTFRATEEYSRTTGIVRFSNEVLYEAEGFRPAEGSTVEIVLLGREEGDPL